MDQSGKTTQSKQHKMVAESALFTADIFSQLAPYLRGRDLCNARATCRALGLGHPRGEHDGLSLVDAAARRLAEGAPTWERDCVAWDAAGWIERYDRLLALRSPLAFDLLLGSGLAHAGDAATVVNDVSPDVPSDCLAGAVCRDHVMRSGRHYATLSGVEPRLPILRMGLIRPIRWGDNEWEGLEEHELGRQWFNPFLGRFAPALIGQKTPGWGTGSVHYVGLHFPNRDEHTYLTWSDFEHEIDELTNVRSLMDEFEAHEVTLMLDLDKGTFGYLRNDEPNPEPNIILRGLSGEYCWMVMLGRGCQASIQKGTVHADLS